MYSGFLSPLVRNGDASLASLVSGGHLFLFRASLAQAFVSFVQVQGSKKLPVSISQTRGPRVHCNFISQRSGVPSPACRGLGTKHHSKSHLSKAQALPTSSALAHCCKPVIGSAQPKPVGQRLAGVAACCRETLHPEPLGPERAWTRGVCPRTTEDDGDPCLGRCWLLG